MVFVALGLSGLLPLFVRLFFRCKAWHAWLIGCMVVPAFVLFAEFVLPYQGGGASMWPIALVVGGVCGAVVSAVGVLLGGWIKRLF